MTRENVVRGENVGLFFYEDNTHKLGACARSCTYTTTTGTIETTVSGSGAWATYMTTKHGFSGSMDGVAFLNEPGMLTLPDFRTLQASGQPILFRLQRVSEAGDLYTEQGYMLIVNVTDTGTYNDVNTYSLEFQGTGEPTRIYVVTPSAVLNSDMRYEYTGGGGEYGLTDPILEDKYIIEVVRDGVGSSKILTSGTPVNKEALYTAGTGGIDWATPLEAGEEVYIIYRNL